MLYLNLKTKRTDRLYYHRRYNSIFKNYSN